jgi:hypothetical protein
MELWKSSEEDEAKATVKGGNQIRMVRSDKAIDTNDEQNEQNEQNERQSRQQSSRRHSPLGSKALGVPRRYDYRATSCHLSE